MTITAHEEQFRVLFAEEAETRLARLGEQLLQLEETGSDSELVASIFREAHTLKGAAAVVGIDDASRVAHALEDLLEDVRSGDRNPTPALVDAALAAVDGLTSMIPRLVAGEDCSEQASSLEQGMRTWSESVSEPVTETDDEETVVEVVEVVASTPTTTSPSFAPVPAPKPAPHALEPRRPARSDNATINVPVARLDELVRLVGESAAAHLRIGRVLTERLGVDAGTVSEFRDLSRVLTDLQERTMRARMVPISTITDQLHRGVRDLARSLGKQVRWEVRGEDTEVDRGVLQHLADPLLHLVRNAIDHGIETPAERVAAGKDAQATVRLHAMQIGSEVVIAVIDDGKGIDVARVRARAARNGATNTTGLSDEDALLLIFQSGLSTTDTISEVSGRGVGLDIVRTSIDAVRGRVEVRSEPGAGSELRIIVPITLAVLPCLLLAAGGQRYAIPMHTVAVAQGHHSDLEAHAEGRELIWVGGSAVPISSLQETLGVGGDSRSDGPVVVVSGVARRHAFQVDALIGQRDVVVKGVGRLLPRIDVLAGASVEPDGSIILVLDAPGLIRRARLALGEADAPWAPTAPEANGARRRSVLVVDDALTVRELQRSILERAGFAVRVAGDGVEALALLAESPVDLVLTDIEMPRMDGFGLTEAIRDNPALANLPVLVLTSRSSEADRQRGLEVGADGYIIKSSFDEGSLLAAVNGLLGQRS